MASNHRHGGNGGRDDESARRRSPEWADGLKQLYDSVVEEDLPDSFKDLIERLDSLSATPRPTSRGGRDQGQ